MTPSSARRCQVGRVYEPAGRVLTFAVCGLRIRIAVDFLIVGMLPELKPWHCERCGADVEDPRLITAHLVPGHQVPAPRARRRVLRWSLL